MIENIRKYTGLMIVVLVLLFVGLVFFSSNSSDMGLAGQQVMEIDGKGISPKEFDRAATSAQRVPELFGNFTPGGLALSHANQLLQMGMDSAPDPAGRFLANRYAVRQGGKDYGVTPGLDEVQRFVRERLFVGPDGTFDSAGYDSFLTDRLGQLGMNSKDFNEILTDLLTAENLREVIGGGLSADLEMTRALYNDAVQEISAEEISFERATYKEKLSPTEEEIKAFWEENKSLYQTVPQRKITYVLAEPDWAAALADVKKTASTDEPAPETPEKTEEAEAGPKSELTPSQRETAVKGLNESVDAFWNAAINPSGADFEELATEAGFKPVATEFFTPEEAPEVLKVEISGARGGDIVSQVFEMNPDSTPDRLVSDPYRTEDGWLIFRLDEAVGPQELPFDEAKARATVDLKEKLATEALIADAEAKHGVIKAAMDGGKTFAEAAKDAGLTVEKRENLTRPEPNPYGFNMPSPPAYELTRRLSPGELSELARLPEENPTRIIFASPTERRVVRDENYQSSLDQVYQRQQEMLGLVAFQNWLNEKYVENDVRFFEQKQR